MGAKAEADSERPSSGWGWAGRPPFQGMPAVSTTHTAANRQAATSYILFLACLLSRDQTVAKRRRQGHAGRYITRLPPGRTRGAESEASEAGERIARAQRVAQWDLEGLA